MEKERSIQIENNKVSRLILSPSAMRKFEYCPAGYVYQNLKGILPNIDTSEMKAMALAGRALHSISEENFDSEFVERILSGESESSKRTVKDMASTAVSREYVTSDSRTEVFLLTEVKDGLFLRGYADRLSPMEKDIKIVDLKSTGDPKPYDDRQQLLGYAFCLTEMSKTISKARGSVQALADKLMVSEKNLQKILDVTGGKELKHDDLSILIDYVRADMVSEFYVTEADLNSYRNYVISAGNGIRRTINSFLQHKDVMKLEHHPGNCGFCPMKGICIAYNLMSNPHFNPVSPDHLSTTDLVKELIEVDDIYKRSEARAKTLKRALILRSSDGDSEVSKHCAVIRSTSSSYPIEEVALRVVPKMMKKATRNVQFRDMVDWEEINKAIVETVIKLSKKNLSPNDVPTGYEKDLEGIKRTTEKAPYIKLK
jgi:hypothetical protein